MLARVRQTPGGQDNLAGVGEFMTKKMHCPDIPLDFVGSEAHACIAARRFDHLR